jgi:hypothetical protein
MKLLIPFFLLAGQAFAEFPIDKYTLGGLHCKAENVDQGPNGSPKDIEIRFESVYKGQKPFQHFGNQLYRQMEIDEHLDSLGKAIYFTMVFYEPGWSELRRDMVFSLVLKPTKKYFSGVEYDTQGRSWIQYFTQKFGFEEPEIIAPAENGLLVPVDAAVTSSGEVQTRGKFKDFYVEFRPYQDTKDQRKDLRYGDATVNLGRLQVGGDEGGFPKSYEFTDCLR